MHPPRCSRVNLVVICKCCGTQAQGSTHGTMGDTAVEQVRDTQAQVQQLEGRLKQAYPFSYHPASSRVNWLHAGHQALDESGHCDASQARKPLAGFQNHMLM